MASDFPTGIVADEAHRPWPLPDAPWVMTQSWHDVLFAHWRVAAPLLREHLPAGVALDLYEGDAWIGVIPFHMTNVAPRGVPSIPFLSTFPELNVRTYVTVHGKPGVYFFSLDAGSALAVAAARALVGLPYFAATMRVEEQDGAIHYASRRDMPSGRAAAFSGTYGPDGPVQAPRPGTLEHFLAERYCLYTVDASSRRVRRLEIHHPPWPLQPARAEIRVNTMAEAAGIRLPATAPLLYFAKRQDTVAWWPTAASG